MPQDKEMSLQTQCLLNYPCFRENYRMIAIDLSKQQMLNADQKVIQQTNFIGNLKRVQETKFADS